MKRLIVILLLPLLASSCCMIDDDMSVCGKDMMLTYKLQLYTELDVQLQTELAAEAEEPVRDALEQWLEPIFTDKAKDVDLRFYTDQEDEIEHQIKEEINDNKTSYTIYLPKKSFMHLAIANIADSRQVYLLGGEHSTTMELRLIEEGDIPSANVGVFTARLPMNVNDSTTNFEVHLYMITAAVALVIDPTLCPDLVSLYGSVQGTADRFMVRDSIYTYDRAPRILMDKVIDLNNSSSASAHAPARVSAQPERLCLAAVGLPSEDTNTWSVRVTATLTNNRHTVTALTVETPLPAGTLRIIKVQMNKNGELEPIPDDDGQTDVGAAVELDWAEGEEYEVDI